MGLRQSFLASWRLRIENITPNESAVRNLLADVHTFVELQMTSPQYVFLSYVHEDADAVEALESKLQGAGLTTWRDTHGIPPGTRWRETIREAIRRGSAFIACFSANSERKDRTYMREEIIVAIEELRLRPRNRAWFFPVKLSPCDVPDIPLGLGDNLADIQHLELFDGMEDLRVDKLVSALWSALGRMHPVQVNDWRVFNWRAIGPVADIGFGVSDDIVTVSAPHGDYGGLYGVASAEEVSDHRVAGEARISTTDEATQGFGMALVPRGSLMAGAPVGWSLQIEWDPPYNQYQARPVTLPPGAWFGPTADHAATPLPRDLGEWFGFELSLSGRVVTGSVAGVGLPGYAMPEDHGSLLIRVWGGEVSVRDVTIDLPQ